MIPFREELKVREFEQFRSAYCGLCHALGRKYGWKSRFLLNYDFTFLAMLLAGEGSVPAYEGRRCMVSCRKKRVCRPWPGMERAADESVILVYWKLRDQIADSGFWKGLPARLLCLIYGRTYRKAAACQPEFAARVRSCLQELAVLEEEKSPSLDRTADTFARILQSAAGTEAGEERRALELLLYHVGRWIYLVDAWDDLEEDRRTGSYNPVALRYHLEAGGSREEAAQSLRLTLGHSLNLALSAFHLLDLGAWGSIVENTLCLGMPMVEELVFTGQWKNRKKSLQWEKRTWQ